MPEDHAFCAECGTVMTEDGPAPQAGADSPELMATISGQYSSNMSTIVPANRQAARRADSPPRPEKVSPPAKVGGSRSGLYFALGLIAVLLLGGLLFYLVGVILSR